MAHEDLEKLEDRIDALISTCQLLREENTSLKTEKHSLEQQHARLVEKTRTARSRIEGMIGRLKALERN